MLFKYNSLFFFLKKWEMTRSGPGSLMRGLSLHIGHCFWSGACARGSSSHRQQISRKVSQFIPPQGTLAILRYTTLFSVILNANNHSQSAAFIALHARQVWSIEAFKILNFDKKVQNVFLYANLCTKKQKRQCLWVPWWNTSRDTYTWCIIFTSDTSGK